MMKFLLSGVTVLVLTACATATRSFDESGNALVRIDCDGALIPMSKCYDKANDECPFGYFKVGESISNVGQFGSAQAAANPYYGNAMMNSTPIVTKSLTVRCKSK